ncbi:MAG: type II toxin-antitoxin system PemK/MazF family toxin [Pyrinomonadaceae bacterium]
MPSYSKSEVILVRYPFSDLTATKVRPAIVVNAPHISKDVIIVPLTSKLSPLMPGEFVLLNWRGAGLNVPSSVKRGIYTVQDSLIIKFVGSLSDEDANSLEMALRGWLGLR